jgi:hypothetical protein
MILHIVLIWLSHVVHTGYVLRHTLEFDPHHRLAFSIS